jgi:hypothetical protein
MSDEAAKEADQESKSAGQELVLKVLGVIGTGIGVLGFVTFFGGAIIWVRADKAGLPATEAVAAIPRSVLVTTGATFLFPAFLIAAAVVAVVFLVYLGFFGWRQRKLKGIRAKLTELRLRAAQTGRSAEAAEQDWKRVDAFLKAKEEDLAEAHRKHASGEEIIKLEAAVAAKQHESARLNEEAERVASSAVTAKANSENLAEESELILKRGFYQRWIELGIAGLALLFVVPLWTGAICHGQFGWSTVILGLVALSGTAITMLAYYSTEKFAWFGITAVVAIGVYLAAGTYVSTHRNAKLQPVAALRSGRPPVVGSFIASTSESFYVGTIKERGVPPRLLVVPRAQVTEFAIGPLLDEEDAHSRAIAMALNLCSQEIEEAKPAEGEDEAAGGAGATKPPAAELKPACSKRQVKDLLRSWAG